MFYAFDKRNKSVKIMAKNNYRGDTKLKILNSRYFLLTNRIMCMSGVGYEQSFFERSSRAILLTIFACCGIVPQV